MFFTLFFILLASLDGIQISFIAIHLITSCLIDANVEYLNLNYVWLKVQYAITKNM